MPGCFAMFLQILTTIGRQANSKIIMINVKTMYYLKERILFWSQDNIPVEMRKKLSDVVCLTQWAIWLALKPHTPKFAPTTTTTQYDTHYIDSEYTGLHTLFALLSTSCKTRISCWCVKLSKRFLQKNAPKIFEETSFRFITQPSRGPY